ncbi:membrane protein [Dethiosulfatarculus sandiegensis]|uniref:Membrane protein n=2 Tax=Dethiosulfatarculus sandiegensis TaxID=1429043 RepID=A0A0D2JBP3_9BACT|nr:membrane protein [Dethiosulfatarculus sandiegensis]
MVENWWNDPNYSHGFLVPLVSFGLIWRRRTQLKRAAAGPEPWGLLFIGIGLFMLLVGQLGHEFYLKRLSLIPVLWGLTLLNWGWKLGAKVIFPFAYLALMVPLPYILYDAVAFPLRLVAASIAGWFFELFGVPVLVEGNVLHLPHIVLNVVDACSGIRSLISLLAVGVIMAYMVLPNRWVKVLVVVFVIPVAVFTNALRVVAGGILAKFYGPQALEGTVHDFTGWLVFMAAFALLGGITWLLNRLTRRKEVANES